MFVTIDTSGDGRLDFEEFQVRHGYPTIHTTATAAADAADAAGAAGAAARSSPAPCPAIADPHPNSPQLI